MEALEKGRADAAPYVDALERHTGVPATALLEPQLTVPGTATGEQGPEAPSRQARPRVALGDAGLLVLGSIATLVLIRFFTEVVHVLPRALNFVDIPILIVLSGAAVLSSKPPPPLDRFGRSLLPLSGAFLVLAALATLANPSRVAVAPGLVFVYGILSPLAIYRAVLRLWPTGNAYAASRLMIGLGLIQLLVAGLIDVPRFTGSNNPDLFSGTFGSNAYQFVFFMVTFIVLVAAVYADEPESLTARFAPALIGAGLLFIVLAQYRALLVPTGLAILLAFVVLSRRRRSRGLVAAGFAALAFMAALAFGAQKVPILKLNQTFKQDPITVVKRRLDIVSELKKLYSSNPRFVITGTGPGTFSSRAWQTFALSNSTSRSNVQGGYAQSLTGGPYHTDVSDKFTRPILASTSQSAFAGSTAANSPFSDYTSVAAEVGIFGLALFLAIYLPAFLGGWRRVRQAVDTAPRGDPLPGLLLSVTIGFFLLLQMGILDNWLEVTRLTFVEWALLAIGVKEFDARRSRPT